MAAYRVFDIFNAKIGSTQVVGATSFEARYGFRAVQSQGDGSIGIAARDKTRLYTSGRLACEDIAAFGTLIGLFEAAESLSVMAEGKLAGNAVKGVKATLAHAKLVGAGLSFQAGRHAQSTFDFRGSVAPATVVPSAEVTVVEVATKAITYAAGLRGVVIKSAVFTPHGGGAITPLGVTGLDVNLRYQADQAAGDNDYGESVEVGSAEVSGSLSFQDQTITTLATVGQQLAAADWGVLAITYSQQAGAADKVLSLANLAFEDEAMTKGANRYGANRMGFGCFFQNGADMYKVGSGTNKIISVA